MELKLQKDMADFIIDGQYKVIQVGEPYLDDEVYTCEVSIPIDYQLQLLRLVETFSQYQRGDFATKSIFKRYQTQPSPEEIWDRLSQEHQMGIIETLLQQVREAVRANLAGASDDTQVQIAELDDEEDDEAIKEFISNFDIQIPVEVTANFEPLLCIQKEDPWDKVTLEIPDINHQKILDTLLTSQFRKTFGKEVERGPEEAMIVGDKVDVQIDLYDDDGVKQDNRGYRVMLDSIDETDHMMSYYLIGKKEGDKVDYDKEIGIYQAEGGAAKQALRIFNTQNDLNLHMQAEVLKVYEIKMPEIDDEFVIATKDAHGCNSLQELVKKNQEQNQESFLVTIHRILGNLFTLLASKLVPYYEIKFSDPGLKYQLVSEFVQEIDTPESFNQFREAYNIQSQIDFNEFQEQIQNENYEFISEYIYKYQENNMHILVARLVTEQAFDQYCTENSQYVDPDEEQYDEFMEPFLETYTKGLIEEFEKNNKQITEEEYDAIQMEGESKIKEGAEYSIWIMLQRHANLIEHKKFIVNPDLTLFDWDHQCRQAYFDKQTNLDYKSCVLSEEDIKRSYRRAQDGDYKEKMGFDIKNQSQSPEDKAELQQMAQDVEFREMKNKKGFSNQNQGKQNGRNAASQTVDVEQRGSNARRNQKGSSEQGRGKQQKGKGATSATVDTGHSKQSSKKKGGKNQNKNQSKNR